MATEKKTRPTGLFRLCERMVAAGTLQSDLEPLYDLLPKDRYGKWTNKDIPVQQALDKLEQMIEEDEEAIAGGMGVRRIMPLTLEKAKAIAKRGGYTLPAPYKPTLENALPDEEFDPEEDEDADDEPAKTKAKAKVTRKRGRKPKAEATTEPAAEPAVA